MLSAQPTTPPNGASTAPFVLRPGVVVDPADQVIYMMRPGGGTDAVELGTGRSIWYSKDAAEPLSLTGDLLVAVAERPAPEAGAESTPPSYVDVLFVGARDGRTRRSVRVPLPEGVWSFVDDGPGRSLHLAATATPSNVILSWSADEHEPIGIDPAGSSPTVSATAVAGRLNGRVRINIATGRVEPLPVDRLAAEALAVDHTLVEIPLLPNIAGAQFLSADGRHVMVSDTIGDDRIWEKYRWRIYTVTGRLVGEITNAFPQAPFYVAGTKLLFEARPFARRTDEHAEELTQEPLKLRLIDLTTREESWNRELRDTTFYGPFPESDFKREDDEEEAGEAAEKAGEEAAAARLHVTAAAFAGTWATAGPAPERNTASPVTPPLSENAGAVHTLVAHPTNANILWAGSVNGGVWKTTNATVVRPTWTQLTDPQTSLSIGALELDPADTTNNTLIAGIGRFSSFGRRGGPRTGLLRTTDGGTTWTSITGGGVLTGKNISAIAVNGARICVSVNTGDAAPDISGFGLWRSTDGGATFTQISNGNGSLTGLPQGITHDIAHDPLNPERLFTGVFDAAQFGGVNGVYRSVNGGATWTKVSNAAMDAIILDGAAGSTDFNMEFVLRGNITYALIVNTNNSAAKGKLAGVFRSADGGATWVAMDVPAANPNSQGFLHLSEAIDPANSSLLYLGGDTAMFRCNAAAARGSQCTTLQGTGTLSGTSPHPDTREMVFDASGLLLMSCDGGVFRRTSPSNNQGDWTSIGNNLQALEGHSMSFDTTGNVVMAGFQDNGVARQPTPGATAWVMVNGGDGGDVAVDTISSPGLSSRYSSSQNLGGFRRQVFNSSNTLQSQVTPTLTLLSGAAPVFQFTTPIRVNNVDGRRLLIGGSNALYESLDQGGSIRQLTPAFPVNASGGHPVVYGAAGNANAIYVGSADTVFVRTAAPPANLVQSTAYPGTGTGRAVVDMAINLDDPNNAFAVDVSTVYMTRTAGASWTDVTGNLQTLLPSSIRSVAHVKNASGEALVVGTNNGVFAALSGSGFTDWSQLGTGVPHAPVYDLDYDRARDVLVASTLGRGAWTLAAPTFSVFTPVTIFSSTFDTTTDGFTFVKDAFGTAQPNYATGAFTATSGFTGGGLSATVGGVDNAVINNMSAGWRRTFTLASSARVSLTFDFNLTQTSEYESDETSDALTQIDAAAAAVQASLVGDGNGGTPRSSGNITGRTVDLGCLAAGTHTVTLGLRNNKKTLNDESTNLLLDNVSARTTATCP